MKNKILANIIAVLLASLMLLAVDAWFYPGPSPTDDEMHNQFGPMADNLLMHVYEGNEQEFLGYYACDIDFMDWPLTATQIEELDAQDPNMDMYARARFTDRGMYQFDLNNMKFPTNNANFRKALAHCFDKTNFVDTQLAGYAMKMDSPLKWAEATGWYNPYCENLYPYSLAAAAAILDAAGYLDVDDDGWREGPLGEEIVLDFYVRQDDPDRTAMGTIYANNLEVSLAAEGPEYAGIDVNLLVVPKAICHQKVIVEFNYHLYTGSWKFNRDPDTLYYLYFGAFAQASPYIANYPGYNNPTFDAAALGMLTASVVGPASTPGTAQSFAWQMQRILMDDVGVIPVFTYESFGAYKTGWEKVVNVAGTGPWGYFTFLNAYNPTDDTIDWGMMYDIASLNVLHAGWIWDWQILDKIYDTLIKPDPYDLTVDKPWMAQSWTLGEWEYGGRTCSWVEFKLREDMYWHDIAPKAERQTPGGTPLLVGGAYNEKVMADDVVFTIYAVRDIGDSWNNALVADVVYAEEIDPYTVRVHYGIYMPLWILHWMGRLPIMPKHVWEPVYQEEMAGNTGACKIFDLYTQQCLSGCGPWIFDYEYSTAHEYYMLRANTRFFRYHPVDIYGTIDPLKVVEPCTEITVRFYLHNQDFQRDPMDPGVFTIEIFKEYPNGTILPLYVGVNPALPACEPVLIFEYTEHIDRGFYTILAIITPDPLTGHTDADGYPVEIWGTIPEDVNLDFYVNIKDAVLLGVAFGSRPGEYNWNLACDINGDGFINIKDAVLIGVRFGWPGP